MGTSKENKELVVEFIKGYTNPDNIKEQIEYQFKEDYIEANGSTITAESMANKTILAVKELLKLLEKRRKQKKSDITTESAIAANIEALNRGINCDLTSTPSLISLNDISGLLNESNNKDMVNFGIRSFKQMVALLIQPLEEKETEGDRLRRFVNFVGHFQDTIDKMIAYNAELKELGETLKRQVEENAHAISEPLINIQESNSSLPTDIDKVTRARITDKKIKNFNESMNTLRTQLHALNNDLLSAFTINDLFSLQTMKLEELKFTKKMKSSEENQYHSSSDTSTLSDSTTSSSLHTTESDTFSLSDEETTSTTLTPRSEQLTFSSSHSSYRTDPAYNEINRYIEDFDVENKYKSNVKTAVSRLGEGENIEKRSNDLFTSLEKLYDKESERSFVARIPLKLYGKIVIESMVKDDDKKESLLEAYNQHFTEQPKGKKGNGPGHS